MCIWVCVCVCVCVHEHNCKFEIDIIFGHNTKCLHI